MIHDPRVFRSTDYDTPHCAWNCPRGCHESQIAVIIWLIINLRAATLWDVLAQLLADRRSNTWTRDRGMLGKNAGQFLEITRLEISLISKIRNFQERIVRRRIRGTKLVYLVRELARSIEWRFLEITRDRNCFRKSEISREKCRCRRKSFGYIL